MKKRHITGFYIETLVLIAAFVAVVLILTQIFGISRNKSRQAHLLTTAVCLAENAAEAVSASDSPEKVLELLDTAGNAQLNGDIVTARYEDDLTPAPDGSITLTVSWEPSGTAAGTLVTSHIDVWCEDGADPVYSIETAVYLDEVTP